MFAVLSWPWLFGAGVAFVVGVIAFVIAGGLVDGRGASSYRAGDRSTRGPSGIKRAS